jgi:hypothetical protein
MKCSGMGMGTISLGLYGGGALDGTVEERGRDCTAREYCARLTAMIAILTGCSRRTNPDSLHVVKEKIQGENKRYGEGID